MWSRSGGGGGTPDPALLSICRNFALLSKGGDNERPAAAGGSSTTPAASASRQPPLVSAGCALGNYRRVPRPLEEALRLLSGEGASAAALSAALTGRPLPREPPPAAPLGQQSRRAADVAGGALGVNPLFLPAPSRALPPAMPALPSGGGGSIRA